MFGGNFEYPKKEKETKKRGEAISKGYVWWHNRAAGWAIAVTQFPATPQQPMHTKQFQTFFKTLFINDRLL